MIGAIIGDIVGSIYEFDNIKTKVFPFFDERMEYTDDSILTIATADWLLHGGSVGNYYLKYATEYPYPMGSYGTMFVEWIHRSRRGIMQPYNSCGNGSAMRIGPVGWAFDTEKATLVQLRFQLNAPTIIQKESRARKLFLFVFILHVMANLHLR